MLIQEENENLGVVKKARAYSVTPTPIVFNAEYFSVRQLIFLHRTLESVYVRFVCVTLQECNSVHAPVT